jgi:hypothetical protein
MAQAVSCFESKEYQDAARFRRADGVGVVHNVIVDGGDATK